MMGLLVFKERLKEFYAKYGIYADALLKFCFSLTAFIIININLGFMTKLKNPMFALLLAFVCSFLPYSAISFLIAAFLLAHISSISFEITLLIVVFILIISLLYYGFRPGDSFLLVLTPMMFFLNIPYVIPLVVGLSGSLVSVIPVGCGVCIYYILLYVKQNAGVLTNDTSVDITQKYVQIIKSLTANQLIIVMVAAFAIGILTVYVIRNMSVDYAWVIAIIIGTIAQLVVIFIGDFMFNISVPMGQLLLGVLISMILAGIYIFFEFAVDYGRTEYVQYEDDDYYYYVKAVPKMAVSTPDVKVQKINTRKGQRHSR